MTIDNKIDYNRKFLRKKKKKNLQVMIYQFKLMKKIKW